MRRPNRSETGFDAETGAELHLLFVFLWGDSRLNFAITGSLVLRRSFG